MARVTADSNILVSALNFRRGKPYTFLQMAAKGDFDLVLSPEIVEETLGVLETKFAWPSEDLAEAKSLLGDIARIVKPKVELNIITEDPDDNRILECASTAAADFIVSGDNDLLRLGQYDAIRILNVSDFLGALQGRQR